MAKSVNGRSVSVSIPGSAQYPNGKPVAEVAKFVEFGTVKMPPRPFARVAVAENRKKWMSLLKKGLSLAILDGSSVEKPLALVGEQVKADVMSEIKAFGAVRTGTLLNSFKVEVK